MAGPGEAPPLPRNVVALGELPPDRIAELYRAADFLLLPSTGEGFPLTAQEALASGLPIVLADDPAYQLYLDGAPDGVLRVERTAGALVEAMRQLEFGRAVGPEHVSTWSTSPESDSPGRSRRGTRGPLRTPERGDPMRGLRSAQGGPVFDPRRSRLGALIGLAFLLGLVLVLIAPRASDVREAIANTSATDFALVVGIGIAAMLIRTVAWQVAVDAAGARVRSTEAHPASAAAYTAGLLSPYLGAALRVALMRRLAPDRVPAAPQLVATEGALAIVEGVLVAALIVVSAWALDIPIWTAVLIRRAGHRRARWDGLCRAAAGSGPFRRRPRSRALPRPLGLVTLALAGSIAAQLVRVGVVLASVGLDHSLLVITAVFVASGASAILPIGTAASGAAAPLLAVPAGGDLADAAAAGIVLSGGLAASCLIYLLLSSAALIKVTRHSTPTG